MTSAAPKPVANGVGLIAAALSTAVLAVAATKLPHGALVPWGTLVLVLAVAAVARWPQALAPLIVVGFSVQPYLKFNISTFFGPAKDAVVVLGVVGTAAGVVLHRKRFSPDRRLVVLLAGFLLVYLVNPGGGHGAGWAFMTRLVVEGLLLFLVGYGSADGPASWRWAAGSAVAVGLLETAVGVWQQHVGLKALVEQYGYAYGQQVRATSGGQLRSFGTLDDPFNYAAIVLLGLVCAQHVLARPAMRRLVTACLAVGVFVSFDRTAFVLVALFVLLQLGRRHRASAICLGLALAVAGVAVLATRPPDGRPTVVAVDDPSVPNTFLLSLNGRTTTWFQVVRNPSDLFFGRGTGAIGAGAARAGQPGVASVQRYQPGVAPPVARNIGLTSLDSSYVQTLADVGLAGLLVLLALLARTVALLRGRSRSSGRVTTATLWVVLLLLADGVTRTSLFAFPFGFMALYMIGCGLAQARQVAVPAIPEIP